MVVVVVLVVAAMFVLVMVGVEGGGGGRGAGAGSGIDGGVRHTGHNAGTQDTGEVHEIVVAAHAAPRDTCHRASIHTIPQKG